MSHLAPSGSSSSALDRRGFLALMMTAGAGSTTLAQSAATMSGLLDPVQIDNPLAKYPNRGWEKVYRDLYHFDSKFTFLCAPNDTHNCLLHGFVKNGVVTRIAPTYAFHEAKDLDGTPASRRWEPRCCQKGLSLVRRFYGDRRVRGPMVRQGFLQWAKAGFPRDGTTGAVDPKYLNRGREPFVKVSWDEANELTARVLLDIATTYSGEQGQQRLRAQGYDDAMVEATKGAGTQVLKMRGGMPALGFTRIMGLYRFANQLALLDEKIRKVDADHAMGSRCWDSYAWHTDLPPGHPMVTGHQTNDFDLCNVEHAKLVLVWGMNWITTKMPDSHWLTEARMKGTRVVVIACEYSATASKGDDVLIVRPGTTPALALGFAQVILAEKLYDEQFVRRFTDLPLLVRLDTRERLRGADVFPGYQNAELKNHIEVLAAGAKPPKAHLQDREYVTAEQRAAWGDAVGWDAAKKQPVAITRDMIGVHADALPDGLGLEVDVEVTLADGKTVRCQSVFTATKQLLDDSYTPAQVSKLTWAPEDAIREVARAIAASRGETLFAMGMGPNQFFNNDLKDRAVFLVAALTGSVGRIGGNVGSFAGNYRSAWASGIPTFTTENPFDIELDPAKAPRTRVFYKGESAHFWNNGDRPLRYGKALLTGKSHVPTPTKCVVVSNGNSLIGNAKWHYDLVVNTLPKTEFIGVADWWWTGSCEYADIVYAVDSWAEMKVPDVTISVTNPFLYTYPPPPVPRIHDSRHDAEVIAGIASALAKLTGDQRHVDMWRFVPDGGMRPYLQRILDHSADMRGFRIENLEADARRGVPALVQTRTYPVWSSYESVHDSVPWFTKTGRLEFYREEREFRDAGENLVIHREPIDATFHEPAVLIADKPSPLLRPKTPQDYGADAADLSPDARMGRTVVRTVDELIASKHPLAKDGFRFIFHTPKYRHGAHTTPVDLDILAAWFGPFGDARRHDKRSPFVGEGYVDINPLAAHELGIEDGDYVWIDADPTDRPYRGAKQNSEPMGFSRLMSRARYYPGTPRGITRMWYNMYGASWGSVQGQKTRPDGLAKSPLTGYQGMYRCGSHQSATRAWLKPTWLTDSLVAKNMFGRQIGQGFQLDIHGATGAPRESFVRIAKAEHGGLGGKGLWRGAALGLRPTYATEAMQKHIDGAYVKKA